MRIEGRGVAVGLAVAIACMVIIGVATKHFGHDNIHDLQPEEANKAKQPTDIPHTAPEGEIEQVELKVESEPIVNDDPKDQDIIQVNQDNDIEEADPAAVGVKNKENDEARDLLSGSLEIRNLGKRSDKLEVEDSETRSSDESTSGSLTTEHTVENKDHSKRTERLVSADDNIDDDRSKSASDTPTEVVKVPVYKETWVDALFNLFSPKNKRDHQSLKGNNTLKRKQIQRDASSLSTDNNSYEAFKKAVEK